MSRDGRTAAPCGASPGRNRVAGGKARRNFYADASRCTQNTRMGRCPAWSFTAATAAPHPGEPRRFGRPCPICVLCVHLPAFALNPCLLRRVPHAAATDPGPRTLRASQNPMHQFARLPPLRRPGGPEADSSDLLPEPHAPIQAASRQDKTTGGRQHSNTNSHCPTGVAHRLARSATRRWCDSPRPAPPTIPLTKIANSCY